jgi:hypothetical protein
MCLTAQIYFCKLLQNAAIFFLHFVSLCSDLMASGNSFQTVAMAARRVPDDFCGGRSPFTWFLVILVVCGQINRPPVNGDSCPSISMPIWILAARDTALRHISPTDVWPVKLRSLLQEVLSLPPMPSAALIAMLCRTCSFLIGIEEVGFGMTGMAWKERSRFWSFRNSLEWPNSFTDCLQWHKLILA